MHLPLLRLEKIPLSAVCCAPFLHPFNKAKVMNKFPFLSFFFSSGIFQCKPIVPSAFASIPFFHNKKKSYIPCALVHKRTNKKNGPRLAPLDVQFKWHSISCSWAYWWYPRPNNFLIRYKCTYLCRDFCCSSYILAWLGLGLGFGSSSFW